MALARILAMLTPQSNPIAYRGINGFAGSGSGFGSLSFSGIGAQVGDLALVAYFWAAAGSDATTMPAGWTKTTLSATVTYGFTPVFYWKILTSSDLSGSVTMSGLANSANQDSVIYAAWRGGSSVTLLTQGSDVSGGTTHTTASVTADPTAAGYITVFQSQQSDTTATANNTFTARGHFGTTGGGGAVSMQAVADSSGTTYTGSAVTWTIGATSLSSNWFLLKVT